MNQGEIWSCNFNPILGNEQSGIRPSIIISGSDLHRFTELAIVCPLTSAIKPIHKCLILEPNTMNGLSIKSQVLTFQIRSISKIRLIKYLGRVDQSLVDQLLDDLNYFFLQ